MLLAALALQTKLAWEGRLSLNHACAFSTVRAERPAPWWGHQQVPEQLVSMSPVQCCVPAGGSAAVGQMDLGNMEGQGNDLHGSSHLDLTSPLSSQPLQREHIALEREESWQPGAGLPWAPARADPSPPRPGHGELLGSALRTDSNSK